MLRSAAFGLALLAFAPAAHAADALETVRGLYVPTIWNPLEGRIDVTTGPALALLERNARQTEANCFDFVVTVDGQDFDEAEVGRTLDLEDTGRGADGATEIRARFQIFGQPQEVLWTMVEEKGGWKVADIVGKEWRLSEFECE